MVRALFLAWAIVSVATCGPDAPILVDPGVKADVKVGYSDFDNRYALLPGQVIQVEVPRVHSADTRVVTQVASSVQTVSFRAVAVGETLISIVENGKTFRVRVVVTPPGLHYDVLLTVDDSESHVKLRIGRVLLLVLVQGSPDFGNFSRIVNDSPSPFVAISAPTLSETGALFAAYRGTSPGTASIAAFTDPAPKGVAVVNFHPAVTA